jgi:hypothetical protein
VYLDIPIQLGCGGFQGGRVLGDQNEVAPVGRGLAGKLKSYSAVAAGDQGEGGLCGYSVHGELLAVVWSVIQLVSSGVAICDKAWLT